jgi:hypothetical protein
VSYRGESPLVEEEATLSAINLHPTVLTMSPLSYTRTNPAR